MNHDVAEVNGFDPRMLPGSFLYEIEPGYKARREGGGREGRERMREGGGEGEDAGGRRGGRDERGTDL